MVLTWGTWTKLIRSFRGCDMDSSPRQWTVANTCDWKALNGCQTSRDIMFDLNYQQSHRRLLGRLPRAGCVCGIQTGDSPVTSGSALEERRVLVAPQGLGHIPTAAFLICETWPITPSLPLAGANTTYDTSDAQPQSRRACAFAGQVGGRWGVVGYQMG